MGSLQFEHHILKYSGNGETLQNVLHIIIPTKRYSLSFITNTLSSSDAQTHCSFVRQMAKAAGAPSLRCPQEVAVGTLLL